MIICPHCRGKGVIKHKCGHLLCSHTQKEDSCPYCHGSKRVTNKTYTILFARIQRCCHYPYWDHLSWREIHASSPIAAKRTARQMWSIWFPGYRSVRGEPPDMWIVA